MGNIEAHIRQHGFHALLMQVTVNLYNIKNIRNLAAALFMKFLCIT